MSSEASLLEEIARLSGAINQRRSDSYQPPTRGHHPYRPPYRGRGRGRGGFTDYTPAARPGVSRQAPAAPSKDVVIDGVAFKSNGKTLVRTDAQPSTSSPDTSTASPTFQSSNGDVPKAGPAKSPTIASKIPPISAPSTTAVPGKQLIRVRNGLVAADRYKASSAKTKTQAYPRPKSGTRYPTITGYTNRAQPGRNLTLKNTKFKTAKPSKIYEKQCKHFTMTGMCARGLTCKYQHDPNKIALCPLFLSDKCPHKDRPEDCNLSHDPTPERTPICSRFNSTGECYKGDSCLYPHIRIGSKTGICRDFAVLGYCDKGAMCEHSHLKECPDFAETGVCKRMGLKGSAGCHLPHVIRANQKRIGIVKVPRNQAPAPAAFSVSPVVGPTPKPAAEAVEEPSAWEEPGASSDIPASLPAAESAGVPAIAAGPPAGLDAEEFISLTFEESDEEDDDDDDDEDDEDEDDDEDDEADEDAVDATMGDEEEPDGHE